jgi:hypothetical protein
MMVFVSKDFKARAVAARRVGCCCCFAAAAAVVAAAPDAPATRPRATRGIKLIENQHAYRGDGPLKRGQLIPKRCHLQSKSNYFWRSLRKE